MPNHLDPRFNSVRAAGGEVYAAYLRAGFREWWDRMPGASTPYNLIKSCYAGSIKLFQVVIKVYDFREFRLGPLGFSAWCQFNTHGAGPTFNVELLDAARPPEEVIEFFTMVYDKMRCEPYG